MMVYAISGNGEWVELCGHHLLPSKVIAGVKSSDVVWRYFLPAPKLSCKPLFPPPQEGHHTSWSDHIMPVCFEIYRYGPNMEMCLVIRNQDQSLFFVDWLTGKGLDEQDANELRQAINHR